MNKTIAYLRVSTDGQDLKNQKYEILDYADKNNFKITDWIEIKVSSRRSTKERLIDELLEKFDPHDTRYNIELRSLCGYGHRHPVSGVAVLPAVLIC